MSNDVGGNWGNSEICCGTWLEELIVGLDVVNPTKNDALRVLLEVVGGRIVFLADPAINRNSDLNFIGTCRLLLVRGGERIRPRNDGGYHVLSVEVDVDI